MSTLNPIFNQPYLASSLFIAFVDMFGLDSLCGVDDARWDPQTVEMEMDAVSGQSIPQNLDKIMAAAEVVSTNHFDNSLPDFIRICNVLSDSPTDGTFDPAEVREIAWAVIEVGLLTGVRPQLSREICGYIQKAIQSEGFNSPPSPLDTIIKPDDGWQTTAQDTEDSELFAMTQDASDGREQEVQQYLSVRLSRLLHEIQTLPISNLEADWVNNIGQTLKALMTNADHTTTEPMD
jgi:hypothetical protein